MIGINGASVVVRDRIGTGKGALGGTGICVTHVGRFSHVVLAGRKRESGIIVVHDTPLESCKEGSKLEEAH